MLAGARTSININAWHEPDMLDQRRPMPTRGGLRPRRWSARQQQQQQSGRAARDRLLEFYAFAMLDPPGQTGSVLGRAVTVASRLRGLRPRHCCPSVPDHHAPALRATSSCCHCLFPSEGSCSTLFPCNLSPLVFEFLCLSWSPSTGPTLKVLAFWSGDGAVGEADTVRGRLRVAVTAASGRATAA